MTRLRTRASVAVLAAAVTSVAVLALGACRASTSSDTPEKRESPQASAQPTPLAVAPTTVTSAAPPALVEGGPPPAPLRGDELLGGDALAKEAVYHTLSAAFRLVDVFGPPRTPEVNQAGLEAARKATELRVAIDLSPTRMRVAFLGDGFVVGEGVELRARSDRYGHLVMWGANGTTWYRPTAPGATRALLGERRLDVAPITPADLVLREDVGRRIGIRTRKAEVTTRAAHGVFEIGRLEGAGEGGVLLCRLVLDLMNAPPGTPLCGLDELPVRSELKWTSKGVLVLELTGALRRTDLPVGPLLLPPAVSSFATQPLPLPGSGVAPMLSVPELAALRTSDVDVPPPAGAPPLPPGDALVIVNPTMELRVLFLDGVPVAWAAPNARGELRGLRRGRYIAQWRTFLGDVVETATTQTVPGIAQVGASADAGAPR